uniref:Uncharacterized protein n=1 Tax=Plectus sambesii TaxID=2011161 RepID=A0A914V2Y2_9BILA
MFTLNKGTTKFGHDILAYRTDDKVITFSVKDRPKGSTRGTRASPARRSSGESWSTLQQHATLLAFATAHLIPLMTRQSVTTLSAIQSSTAPTSSNKRCEEHLKMYALERPPLHLPSLRSTCPVCLNVNATCSDPDILGCRLRKGKSSTKNALKMRNKFNVPSAYKETLCNQDYLIHRMKTLR